MTKLEEYKEGLKRRRVKLTDEEKQLVEELDDDMYTVEFLEDYSEYNDTKGPNALMLFMAAQGFRTAMCAIIRNRTERRGSEAEAMIGVWRRSVKTKNDIAKTISFVIENRITKALELLDSSSCSHRDSIEKNLAEAIDILRGVNIDQSYKTPHNNKGKGALY